MSGVRRQVAGVRCQVVATINARYWYQSLRFGILMKKSETQRSFWSSRREVSSGRCEVSGQALGARCQVFGVRCEVSGVRC